MKIINGNLVMYYQWNCSELTRYHGCNNVCSRTYVLDCNGFLVNQNNKHAVTYSNMSFKYVKKLK